MKHYALELLGFCVGFVGLLGKPPSPEEPVQPEFSGSGPCPFDRYEAGSDYRPVAGHLVQIGALALHYRPNPPGASASNTPGGRRPPGPVRIIASAG
jgi:hypothetical protein